MITAVGYSMGGFMTNKLRETHPERLLSATIGGAGWSPEESATFRTQLAEALDHGSVEPLVRRLTPVGQPEPKDDAIQRPSWNVSKSAPKKSFSRNPFVPRRISLVIHASGGAESQQRQTR